MSTGGAASWGGGAVPIVPPEMLSEIIAGTCDLTFLVTAEGRVLSVLTNPAHDLHGHLDHWKGADLRHHLTSESVPKLDDALADAQTVGAEDGSGIGRIVELNHIDGAPLKGPFGYTVQKVASDGTVLMLGRDLHPLAEMQRQLVQAQIALERDYEARRALDLRYRALMSATHEAALFISADTGRVIDLNAPAATLIGEGIDDAMGRPVSDIVADPDPVERLLSAAASDDGADLRLEMRNGIVLARPLAFRANGERVILAILRSDAADGSIATAPLSKRLSALWAETPDGIVFTDDKGVIRSANPGFLDLVEAASPAAIQGQSLTGSLGRGAVDLGVLIEQAGRAGRLRGYATRLKGRFGADRAVEISVTTLPEGAGAAFAFLFRDTGAGDTRRHGAPVSDDAVRSVLELVGSSPLKDIVSETTDVVEKICIETAVELTSNNRVAAAEMLGLSRQSLYVKLRKYGLINRGGSEE